MNATTTSTITDKPSMCWPMVNCTPPACHQVHVCTTGETNCSSPAEPTREIHCHAAPSENTRLATRDSTPSSLPFFGNFLPKSTMRKNPIVGTTGASHALSRNHPPSSGDSASAAAGNTNDVIA